MLQPIIQTQDEGKVSESLARRNSADRNKPKEDTLDSLQLYARHLIDNSPATPVIPSQAETPGGLPKSQSSRSLRPRKGDFVPGDDELVEEGHEGCGEAVEILSRHSPKSMFPRELPLMTSIV